MSGTNTLREAIDEKLLDVEKGNISHKAGTEWAIALFKKEHTRLLNDLLKALPEKPDLTFMHSWQDGQIRAAVANTLDEVRESINNHKEAL